MYGCGRLTRKVRSRHWLGQVIQATVTQIREVIMSEKGFASLARPPSVELSKFNRRHYIRTKSLVIGLSLGALGAGSLVLRTAFPALLAPWSSAQVANGLCPQAKPITPVKHSAVWDSLVEMSASDKYKERTVEWLSGAVKIRYVWRPLLASRGFGRCTQNRVVRWHGTRGRGPSLGCLWTVP